MVKKKRVKVDRHKQALGEQIDDPNSHGIRVGAQGRRGRQAHWECRLSQSAMAPLSP